MAPSRGTRGKGRVTNTPRGSTRRTPRSTRAAKDSSVPDVYQDLLAEASATESADGFPDRPLKKRKLAARATPSKDDSAKVSKARTDHVVGSSSELPNADEEDGGDEDSDVDFEDVDLDQPGFGTSAAAEDSSEEEEEIQDLAISVDASTTTPSRRAAPTRTKPISASEKAFRILVHKAHLLCTLGHCMYVNARCNDDKVQKLLRSKLEKRTISYLHTRSEDSQFQRNRSFMDGLQQASDAWRGAFAVTASGMRRARWPADASEELENGGSETKTGDLADFAEFRKAAKTMQGSQDVGNQLFCAMLRAVGVEARVVCSLQVLPFGNVPAKGSTPHKDAKHTIYANAMSTITIGEDIVSDSNASDTAAIQTSNTIGRNIPSVRQRLGQPSFQVEKPTPSTSTTKPKPRPPIRKLQYPILWTEAFNTAQQKWIPVDPIVTQTVGKPSKLEPPASYEWNQMSHVIAFEEDGVARDVTRRYARAYNAKTRRSRIEGADGEAGAKWIKKSLRLFRRRGRRLDRDQLEDAELAQREAREGLPGNVQDFKGHPVYALERHLRRHETLHPRREVGKVNAGTTAKPRMEIVYRRSDVKIVRSAEKWYRFGRVVREGEQGLKSVPSRKAGGARGTPRKEEDGDFDIFGEQLEGVAEMEDLYAESQTEPYIPPPVLGGRVPKNAFGNLDIYVPSMVPSGAVHIRHPMTAHAARLLGISYSDAVTGFSFSGRQRGRRRGQAVVEGAVVAEEQADAVRAAIEGLEEEKVEEESRARSLMALKGWRRFLTALRIKERVSEYSDPNGVVNVDNGMANDDVLDVSSRPVVNDENADMPTAGLYTLEELMLPTPEPSARNKKKQKVGEDESEEAVSSAYEEAENDTDDDEGGFEKTTRSRRATRRVVDEDSEDEGMPDVGFDGDYNGGVQGDDGNAGGFLPDDGMNGDDVGGGFLPDDNNDTEVDGSKPHNGEDLLNTTGKYASAAIESGVGFPTYDYDGGGFLVDEEPLREHITTSASLRTECDPDTANANHAIPVTSVSTDLADHHTIQLDTKQSDIQHTTQPTDSSSHQIPDVMANNSIEDVNKAQESEVNEVKVEGEDALSDHGSMLSHDPEDEDAEPDWLESD